MPHFAIVRADGDTHGAVELGRPDWPDGSIIYRGDGPNLRVVGRIEADDLEHQLEVLVVEEAWVRKPDMHRNAPGSASSQRSAPALPPGKTAFLRSPLSRSRCCSFRSRSVFP